MALDRGLESLQERMSFIKEQRQELRTIPLLPIRAPCKYRRDGLTIRELRAKDIRPDSCAITKRNANIALENEILFQCSPIRGFLPSLGKNFLARRKLTPSSAEVAIRLPEDHVDSTDSCSHVQGLQFRNLLDDQASAFSFENQLDLPAQRCQFY